MLDIRNLMDKIQTWPPERVAEVEAFVNFPTTREQARVLTSGAAAARAPALAGIWDNSEDSVYDAL
jgi:hypothetical protein